MERLGELAQLTTILEPVGFADRLHAEATLRKIANHQWPDSPEQPPLPTNATPRTLDYALVPVVTELVLTEGLDYSHSKNIHVIAVKAQLTLKLVNYLEQRELPSITVSSTLSYGGNKQRSRNVIAATKLVVDDLVAQGMDQLRKYVDFRRQLKLTPNSDAHVTFPKSYELNAGDGYAFVDSAGNPSGFATVRAIEPGAVLSCP